MSQVQSADFQVFTNLAVVNANETLVGASVPAVVESPTCKCSVKVLTVLTAGIGPSGWTIKIYRGKDLTGALVYTSVLMTAGVATGAPGTFASVAMDSLSNAGQAQYCFSVTQPGATSNGTVNLAAIETMVLSG